MSAANSQSFSVHEVEAVLKYLDIIGTFARAIDNDPDTGPETTTQAIAIHGLASQCETRLQELLTRISDGGSEQRGAA
jgi:hypothetical protein